MALTQEQIEAVKATGKGNFSGRARTEIEYDVQTDPDKPRFEFVFNDSNSDVHIMDLKLSFSPKDLVYLPALFSKEQINGSSELRRAIMEMGVLKPINDPEEELSDEDLKVAPKLDERFEAGGSQAMIEDTEPNPYDAQREEILEKDEMWNARLRGKKIVRNNVRTPR